MRREDGNSLTVAELDELPPGTVIQLDTTDDETFRHPEATKIDRRTWLRDGVRHTAAGLLDTATWYGIKIVSRGAWVESPGAVRDMPESVYHGDPVRSGSLSVSRAKVLLQAAGPARFRWDEDHPRKERAEFDFGHAAHALVLGVGDPIRRIEFDDLRTKAAREAVAAARAAGEVPLKRGDYAQVEAMARQIENTPGAVAALTGEHEVSVFREHECGVWLRGRFDSLGEDGITDYKTAVSADPAVFARNAHEYGYDMQAAWYMGMGRALDLIDPDARFRFVVQEKTAPYLVSVIALDEQYLDLGHRRCEQAIELFRACTETGEWPGFPDSTVIVSPPAWLADTTLDPAVERELLDLLEGHAA